MTDPNREKTIFFCQNEALETAIYITEVAKKYGDAWIENAIREANDMSNPGLPRTAFKMTTASGKTVVMAMLIAWHTINKRANPQDARFSNTFLIATPGITIRDRLRVLLPNCAGSNRSRNSTHSAIHKRLPFVAHVEVLPDTQNMQTKLNEFGSSGGLNGEYDGAEADF